MTPISTQTLNPTGTPGNVGDGGAPSPGDPRHFEVDFTPKPAPTLVWGPPYPNSFPPSQLDPLEDRGAQPTRFLLKVTPPVYGRRLQCCLDPVPSLARSHWYWGWL